MANLKTDVLSFERYTMEALCLQLKQYFQLDKQPVIVTSMDKERQNAMGQQVAEGNKNIPTRAMYIRLQTIEENTQTYNIGRLAGRHGVFGAVVPDATGADAGVFNLRATPVIFHFELTYDTFDYYDALYYVNRYLNFKHRGALDFTVAALGITADVHVLGDQQVDIPERDPSPSAPSFYEIVANIQVVGYMTGPIEKEHKTTNLITYINVQGVVTPFSGISVVDGIMYDSNGVQLDPNNLPDYLVKVTIAEDGTSHEPPITTKT